MKKEKKLPSGDSSKSSKKKKNEAPIEEPVDARAAARARAQANKAVVAQSSSWTGKLPATLLFEHCQKQKWEKVVFDSRQVKNGFVITAVLGKRNPKTGSIDTVKLCPPADLIGPQPTALEARHVTATYALHRIMSHRNLRMMLPTNHRDLWVKMDEIKKQQPPENMYLYSEDPFQAQIDHEIAKEKRKQQMEESRAVRAKQNVIREARRALEHENSDDNASTEKNDTTNTNSSNSESKTVKHIRYNNGFSMAKKLRSRVEAIIRKHHGFRLTSEDASLPKSTNLAQIQVALQKLGFERFQVEEALSYRSSMSGALEWLLIHVPEDDLPEMFSNQHVGGVAANIQSGELKTEYALREFRKYGYSEEVARTALVDTGNDKRRALVVLTHLLAQVDSRHPDQQEIADSQTSEEFWKEEMESLEAILEPTSFTFSETESCCFVLNIGQEAKSKQEQIKVTIWRSDNYPNCIPGIAIEPQFKVAKYVLLDVLRKTAMYAQSSCLGEFMVLSIVEWIKENFNHVRTNPSKLTELAAVVTGDAEPTKSTPKESTKKAKEAPRKHKQKTLDPEQLLRISENMKTDRANKLKGEKLTAMIKSRQSLPAWQKRDEILKLVNQHQIVLVTGETGSGKSTQVVQFILDELIDKTRGSEAQIICTQPRRISAMGLAQRVADERTVNIGSEIGYIIRGESKVTSTTNVKFVTAGVLLRMIQTNGLQSLETVSHVVIDEVHERSLDSDYLLILIRRLCRLNNKLKVVLMSATVDPSSFISYFGGSSKVGYTHIEGRTFPVQDVFLDQIIPMVDYIPESLLRTLRDDETISSSKDVGKIIVSLKDGIDYKLVARVVQKIHQKDLSGTDGSILIFMSGSAEIDRAIDAIEQNPATRGQTWSLPLHSGLSPSDQRRVFDSPPKGKRKIVVTTNIAETSITIPDVVAVVDSGRVKETVYDPQTNLVKLVDNWASKAAVTQRRGRAGRVREGICYKLYSKSLQDGMANQPDPEMKRSPLEQLYLSVKSMGIGDVGKFLGEALDPPDTVALETARNSLMLTGLLDSRTTDLTPLGKHVSSIPTDIRSAKLLILSSAFGCLSSGLTIVAVMSSKSPFFSPKEQREEAKNAMRSFSANGEGDILASVAAFNRWQKLRASESASYVRNWCKDNFLSVQTLFDLVSTRRQLLSSLQEIGFVVSDKEDRLPNHYNHNNHSGTLIRAIIGASMIPNVAEVVLPKKTYIAVSGGTIERDAEAKSIRYFTSEDRIFIHPGSTLFGENKFMQDCRFLSFASKMATTKLFMSGITPVGTYGLLFFSNSIAVDPVGSGILVNKWVGLRCWPRVGILVRLLQQLFNQLLEIKFSDPSFDICDQEVTSIVQELIETDGTGR